MTYFGLPPFLPFFLLTVLTYNFPIPSLLYDHSFAIQLAHALGATVIIRSSSEAKLEFARKLGAKHGINYKTHPDWEKEVLKVVSPSYARFIDTDSFCIPSGNAL